jgi:hypothetical protein
LQQNFAVRAVRIGQDTDLLLRNGKLDVLFGGVEFPQTKIGLGQPLVDQRSQVGCQRCRVSLFLGQCLFEALNGFAMVAGLVEKDGIVDGRAVDGAGRSLWPARNSAAPGQTDPS